MALLTGQADEQHRPQVADQLHLGAGGLQRQNVVLIENGHGLQGVVVPGVLAGSFVGHSVQIDLHHTGLAGQVLRLGGHAVEGVAHGESPGQLRKGLRRLAFKIKGIGQVALVQLEHGLTAGLGRGSAVGEVDDLIIVAVVRDGGDAVGAVALHHAAVGQVSVIVGHGVVGLVIGGGDAVINGGCRDGTQGHQGGQGATAPSQELPLYGFQWISHLAFSLYKNF